MMVVDTYQKHLGEMPLKSAHSLCFRGKIIKKTTTLLDQKKRKCFHVQSNIITSNTDGSFTMAHSNSFLCAYEILLEAPVFH